MFDKDKAIQNYEKLIADKVTLTEELAQIRDKILTAQSELRQLDKAKEAFKRFQIDHHNAKEEIKVATQKSLDVINKSNENISRIQKQEQERIDAKLEELSAREKAISVKEKSQNAKELDLSSREEKVGDREIQLTSRINEAKTLKEENEQESSRLTVAESNLEQAQKQLAKDQANVKSEAEYNIETVKSIQTSNAKLLQREKAVKSREQQADNKDSEQNKREQDLDSRQFGIDQQKSKQDARDNDLNKRAKDLNDKEKNLNGEKEDLAYDRAKLNSALEQAKKKGIIK